MDAKKASKTAEEALEEAEKQRPLEKHESLQLAYDHARGRQKILRAELNVFYDELPNDETLGSVSRACFKELTTRASTDKERKKKEKNQAVSVLYNIVSYKAVG